MTTKVGVDAAYLKAHAAVYGDGESGSLKPREGMTPDELRQREYEKVLRYNRHYGVCPRPSKGFAFLRDMLPQDEMKEVLAQWVATGDNKDWQDAWVEGLEDVSILAEVADE